MNNTSKVPKNLTSKSKVDRLEDENGESQPNDPSNGSKSVNKG